MQWRKLPQLKNQLCISMKSDRLTGTVSADNLRDELCFNAVDDEIGDSGHLMAVLQYLNIRHICGTKQREISFESGHVDGTDPSFLPEELHISQTGRKRRSCLCANLSVRCPLWKSKLLY